MSSVGGGRKEELLGWEAGLSGGREVRQNEGDRLCIGFKVVAVSKNADFFTGKKEMLRCVVGCLAGCCCLGKKRREESGT